MKKIVTLLIGLLLASLEICADENVSLCVGEKKLLDAMNHMNLSNAISNVKWYIDADKLHEGERNWSMFVAPSKYYDGEATVKCTWTEKDQHTPYPYTTYYRSYTWKIRCNDNPIVLYTTELRLKPGEYGNIRVDCTYSNISYFYNCSYEWHFSTKNSSVAKVQQTGLVEAVGPGQTEIVISSPNAKDDKYCKVIVESTPTNKLTLIASPSGGEVPANTIVTLTAKSDGSSVTGCDIFYTLNGYTPSRSSTPYNSSGITISKDCTLKAIAYKDGYETSDELNTSYTIEQISGIQIDATNFPDENFRNYLLEQDYGKDGVLTENEVKGITSLNIPTMGIRNLKGLFILKYLKYLYCYQNQITALDISKNTALVELQCFSNELTSLDVSNNTALTSLQCGSNQLASLDVSKNTTLTSLSCSNNQLISLDISKNTALITLDCTNNELTALDLSKNTALVDLFCHSNQLASLNVSKNTILNRLWCYKNHLTSLDVSNNPRLTVLDCYNNQLTSLNVSNNTALKEFACGYNHLCSLDVSNNTALKTLNCSGNQLSSLDVSKNTQLKYLLCDDNQLTSLDVSNNIVLERLCCNLNQIKGSAMDNLISSLPQNTTSAVHEFYCIDPKNKYEGNVCTKIQVEAVKAKGWFPCYYDINNREFIEYEGSDEPNADVNGDGTVDVADISSIISVMAGQSDTTLEKAADVNGDGTVDVADIAAVITRMAELARQQHTIAEEE